jgi:hypothetical protein
VALNHEHGDARGETAEPGEAVAEPAEEVHDDIERMVPAGAGDDVE